MKRFIVEQKGFVQIEACRRFLIEVPDHFSGELARQWVEAEEESLPGDDSMAWCGGLSDHYVGYDVEIAETDVHDAGAATGAPATDGLRVVSFDGLDKP